ncbi:MAG: PAS domain S-box protein [Deltaproteobacteria bacterium]|nr:PAS domain S-box protein [Deltaproteobacteria bacterium]
MEMYKAKSQSEAEMITMENVPLYHSRIMNSYVEYLKKHYPHVFIDSILRDSGIANYELEDEGHWFTQKQHDRFHEILVETTDNPDIAREAGRYITASKASGILRQYVVGFFTPAVAYWMLEKIGANISRHVTTKTNKIAANKVEITVTQNAGIREKPYQCENRIGMFEALSKVFTKEYAYVEHPECMHNGDECCRYIVTWEMTPALLWKKVANYFSFIALLVSLTLFFALPIVPWIILTLSSALVSAGLFFFSEHMEKKELEENIESKANAADQLLDQINIRYNEALLIQEIGQAASSILDIDNLLKYIMEILEKRLDFDRGMIMLANKERNRLFYTVGYGYNHELEGYIKKIRFNLDNPHSKGEFVIAFREQRPILVNDVKEIEKDLSKKTWEFAKKLGTLSFICVPIVYEDKSEGILAVDNVRSKKPFSQSDLSLLMGIAPQIGISINNARAYQLVQESRERFRALSENAPDIVLTVGTDGTFTYINPSWEKILGHTKEEVIGKHFNDFVREGDDDTFINLFKGVVEDKTTIKDFIGTLIHKNGAERIFNMNGAPNFDTDGNVIGLVGLFKDITHQRKLETELRQAQKMQAMGTLSGGIAHDFNNILTPIIGYTELMMSTIPEESQMKWMLDRVINASYRAKDLVKQILTFSRQTEQERKPVQINLIIKEALRLLRASLPTTIEIRQNIDCDSLILGDPTQIHQVFMNLCTNAGHAMQENGGILEVSLSRVEIDAEFAERHPNITPGPYVRMAVADSGHGMTPEVMERIFEPFFTTKNRAEGTGMGLSVVHGIVKNHDGIISGYSEPGKGSIFHVYLPVLTEDITSREDTNEPLPMGNERILFIDDEQSIIEIGADVFESLGYDVTTEKSSVDALALFKSKPDDFDLVITDMTMPEMTGDKLAHEMLQTRPDIPIIICTGYSAQMTKEKAEDIGIRAFVMKPILKDEISRTIRNALSEKEC